MRFVFVISMIDVTDACRNPWYAFDPTTWNVYRHGLGYLSTYSMLDRYQEVVTAKGKRQYRSNLMGGKRANRQI